MRYLARSRRITCYSTLHFHLKAMEETEKTAYSSKEVLSQLSTSANIERRYPQNDEVHNCLTSHCVKDYDTAPHF